MATKITRIWTKTLLAMVGTLLSASACTSGTSVQTTELLNHHNCTGLDAGVHEVDLARVAALRGSKLLNSSAATPPNTEGLTLVAVSKGSQPTPGYGFSVADAKSDGSEITLHLSWQTPPTDAVLAQVLTHPCIVVGLTQGTANTVVVVDQSGELGRVTLAAPK